MEIESQEFADDPAEEVPSDGSAEEEGAERDEALAEDVSEEQP